MKKIYMTPVTFVVKIQTSNMIASSFNGQLNLSGAAEFNNSTDEMGSRRGGFWDDEE